MIRKWMNNNFPWCFTCNKNTVTRLLRGGHDGVCGWCDTPRVTRDVARNTQDHGGSGE